MKLTRFVIVGYGNIGKRHAALIEQNEFGQLSAIVELDELKRNEASKKHNVPVFESFDAFISVKIPTDVVNICTPNYLHIQQTIDCLKHNLHVVCEKPFGLFSTECNKAIELAKQKNKHLFCVMQNRYSPPSKWLKEIVTTNKLGKVFYVQLNCFWNRDARYYTEGTWRGTKEKDGGVLYTQFSHFIDTLYWLFGDIENIHSKIKNYNHPDIEIEDTGTISFDIISGGSGTFNYSTSCFGHNLESSITIIAEKGTVKVSGQYMERFETCNIENYTMPELEDTNPPNNYKGYQGSASNHAHVINNVIATLNEHTSPDVSAEDGSKVVEIIERIYAS